MTTVRLTQRRIDEFRPRKSVYDIRDRDLKGFGVRIMPSGTKSWFVHIQSDGRRTWRTLGKTAEIGLDDARTRARALLAAARLGESGTRAAESPPFETVAEGAFESRARLWKPGTLAVNRSYYSSLIRPAFAGRPIAGIDGLEVRRWFASLSGKPAGANRSLPILSVVMRHAEGLGYRPEGSNPCKGIRRYRRPGRERFLSAAEFARLGAALDRCAADRPMETAILRLLLLTGCRKGEILTLKWQDYREGRLFLRDGKTGPRTVWLSTPAREVLDRLPSKSAVIFPSSKTGRPLHARTLDAVWFPLRAEVGLDDVHLHDLRHSYASMVIAQGETVLAVGKLLGHANPATTFKYIHLADPTVREAANVVGAILAGEG